jgi:hypothetical protein
MFVYVESLTNPSIRFQVLDYDKESGKAKLRGAFGAEFTRSIAKADLKKYGFKVVPSEKELSLGDAPGLKKVGTIAEPGDPVVEVGKKKVKG